MEYMEVPTDAHPVNIVDNVSLGSCTIGSNSACSLLVTSQVSSAISSGRIAFGAIRSVVGQESVRTRKSSFNQPSLVVYCH